MSRHHHRWTVDALEDDVARVEIDAERMVSVPRWLLPADVREGDVLRVVHEREGERSVVTVERDAGETLLAYERSAAQLREIEPRGTGDIVL
jgi:hypothetical protein